MTEEDAYPRFSRAEFARRYEAVRGMMSDRGLDALVVFGWSAIGRAGQADVHYLSNYLGMRDNYVVFPLAGDPVLFVQGYNHVPNAQVVSPLEDVRWGGTDGGATIGDELRRRHLRSVGAVGWIPYQHYESMRKAAAEAAISDVTGVFRRLRVRKSAEELEWCRRGAAFTDLALAALARELRPGLREYELGAIIEEAYLREGGLTTISYVASTPMSAPERCVPAQVLSSRRIEAGDLVTTEISASYGGYAGQGLRTYTVAAEPVPIVSELHDVASEVYGRVAKAIRPGAGHEEVWEAARPIADHGFTIRDDLVHGFGIGILPPSIRTRETTHRDEAWTFERDQTVVIQPNVVTADETVGVQTGNLCVVGDEGAVSLHRFPTTLVRAG